MCPNMSKPDLTFLNLEHRWTGSKAAGTFTWLNLWKKVGHIDLVTTIELYCYYHHYSCMYVAQLILLVKYFMFLTNQLIFEVNNTRWRCFLLGCNWSRDLLAYTGRWMSRSVGDDTSESKQVNSVEQYRLKILLQKSRRELGKYGGQCCSRQPQIAWCFSRLQIYIKPVIEYVSISDRAEKIMCMFCFLNKSQTIIEFFLMPVFFKKMTTALTEQ